MTQSLIEPTTAAAVLVSTEPGVLARIVEPAVELALWRRQLPAGLSAWLDALPADTLPSARLMLPATEAADALHAACDASGTPRGKWRDALVADAADIAMRFARITGSASLGLQLEPVDGDACRRWHRDCVPLRLLTTYRGPGTEWVAPAFAAQALAVPDAPAASAQCLAAHDIAVFKGCGFTGQRHEQGIVHRSPPIAGSGVTRLVLCLNLPRDWRAP